MHKFLDFSGTATRREYLVYGILVPYITFFSVMFASSAITITIPVVFTLVLVMITSLAIRIAAILRRARDAGESKFFSVLLGITPVAITFIPMDIFLLLTPKKGKPNWISYIVISILTVLLVLLVIAAILDQGALTNEALSI